MDLRRKPNQPQDIICKKDADGRKFLTSWYNTYGWLAWESREDGNGVVFCHPCRQLFLNGAQTTSKAEDAFTKTGFQKWKKAFQVFSTHENSRSHRDSIYKSDSLIGNENVLARLNTQHEKERHQGTQCLAKVVTSLQYSADKDCLFVGTQTGKVISSKC
jgi:hypothetical protein